MIKLLTDYWRIGAFVVLGIFALYQWDAHSRAVDKLEKFKVEVEKAQLVQQAEFTVKLANANNDLKTAEAVAAEYVKVFNLDRTVISKDLKRLYENIAKLRSNTNARGVLLPGGNPVEASQTSSNTEGSPGDQSECYPALSRAYTDYDTLEKACTLTTIDFNRCRAVIDADTAIYGRETE